MCIGRRIVALLIAFGAIAMVVFIGVISWRSTHLPRPGEFVAMIDAERLDEPSPEPAEDWPALHDTRRSFAFDGMPLADAYDSLQRPGHIRIRPNWLPIEGNGVDKNVPITLHMENATVAEALDAVSRAGSVSGPTLRWRVVRKIVRVTTDSGQFCASDLAFRIVNARPILDALAKIPEPRQFALRRHDWGESADLRAGAWRGSKAQTPEAFLTFAMPATSGCWGSNYTTAHLDGSYLIIHDEKFEVRLAWQRLDELARQLGLASNAADEVAFEP